jgi:hypothetical protein
MDKKISAFFEMKRERGKEEERKKKKENDRE